MSEDEPPHKKVNPWYDHAFCDECLKDKELKDWLKMDPTCRYSAICTVCSCTFTNANKTALIAHKMTKKHQKNFEVNKNTLSIDKFVRKPTEPTVYSFRGRTKHSICASRPFNSMLQEVVSRQCNLLSIWGRASTEMSEGFCVYVTCVFIHACVSVFVCVSFSGLA